MGKFDYRRVSYNFWETAGDNGLLNCNIIFSFMELDDVPTDLMVVNKTFSDLLISVLIPGF